MDWFQTVAPELHAAWQVIRRRERVPEVPPEPPVSPLAAPEPRDKGGHIRVKLGLHWAVLGMSGTGKTYFTKRLLRELSALYPGIPTYILDSKGEDDFEGYPNIVTDETVPPLVQTGFQVWRPGIDRQSLYDDYFGQLLRAPNYALIVVDEASSITRHGEPPENFKRLLKQARSMQKTVITCTQEFVESPRQSLSQSSHVVRFFLQNDYDRRLGNDLVGMPRERQKTPEPPKYGFYYGSRFLGTAPRLYRNMSEFF